MKQKALVSGQAISASGGRLKKETGVGRSLGITLLWCGLGLLLPRATVCGTFAPFGVGLAAAMKGRRVLYVGLCVVFGYLLAGRTADAFLYALAVTVAAGLHWVANSLPPLRRSRLLPPILAGVATFAAGMWFRTGAAVTAVSVALLFANALLAAGFAAACARTDHALQEWEVAPSDRLALGTIAATALAAAGTVEIGGIAPGHILTLVCVLFVAYAGREGDGAALGTACCLLTVLTAPEQISFAVTLAAAGLLAGVYARFGRAALSLLTVTVSGLFHAASGDGETLLIGIYEATVAGLVLLILPVRWEEWLRQWLCRREEHSAVAAWQLHWHNRLDLASQTLSEMAQTVEEVSDRLTGLTGPSLGDVYAGLADNVCRHCPKKMVCWHSRYEETMDALNRLTPLLREHGAVSADALVGALQECPQRDQLARQIGEGFRTHRVRESAYARLSELRRGVTGQFEEVSGLLAEWAERADDSDVMDIDMARRVRELCVDNGMSTVQVTCRRRKNGSLTVQLWLRDDVKLPDREWQQALSAVCGQALDEPVVCCTENLTCLTFCPPPLFRVCIGTAQWSCGGQALCGDAVEQFTDDSGRVTALISDGMGCGGRAAVDGTMCAALTARLLGAGFCEDSALHLVNTALMVRAGEESLATLDMMQVDVYTGTLVSRKAGAAASLLYSGGRISRIEQTSLPVGILREVQFAEYHDRLTDGDVVLMVSDGVYLGGSGWVEELLADFPADSTSYELAQAVIQEARRRAPVGREDDMTAVALKIEKI